MPAAVALRTHLCLAPRAFPIFTACVGAAASIGMDVGWFDPFAASALGAVESVLCGVFLVFLIPFHLEFKVEELVHVFERDVLGGVAAFRGHVLGIGDGKSEDAAEAGMTHAVTAGEVSGAGGGVSGETGEAFDLFFWWRRSEFWFPQD